MEWRVGTAGLEFGWVDVAINLFCSRFRGAEDGDTLSDEWAYIGVDIECGRTAPSRKGRRPAGGMGWAPCGDGLDRLIGSGAFFAFFNSGSGAQVSVGR